MKYSNLSKYIPIQQLCKIIDINLGNDFDNRVLYSLIENNILKLTKEERRKLNKILAINNYPFPKSTKYRYIKKRLEVLC